VVGAVGGVHTSAGVSQKCMPIEYLKYEKNLGGGSPLREFTVLFQIDGGNGAF